MKKLTRSIILAVARVLGTRVVDHESGKPLGRALIVAWRGKVHVIGLEAAVRPQFLPQQRLTYWKQELGFSVHPPPDFERIADAATGAAANPNGAEHQTSGS